MEKVKGKGQKVKVKAKGKSVDFKALEKVQAQAKEYLAGWQRAKADYLNYRKRMEEQKVALVKYCNEDLISQLLPVIDSFDLALKHVPKNLQDNDWVSGMIAIQDQLLNLLKENGVTEIETEGKKFDPHFHEAVEHVKNKDFKAGMVVEEVTRGFKLNDKVIRAAKVKVAR
jgi:molecular chaperone GrpE